MHATLLQVLACSSFYCRRFPTRSGAYRKISAAMNQFSLLLEALTWRDALDILAVFILTYNVLQLIRGTRAVQVLFGIVFLIAISQAARMLELTTLESTLERFFVILPFALIVLFQNQIRKALANFGKNPLYGLASAHKVKSGLNEIVLAASTLSSRKVGALIILERIEGLRDYTENGSLLDAEISFDLLITIFNTSTPLHDGAVIVQGDRLAAAACFLPLTSNSELSLAAGTRHRAALGISEETDALALVVSEETGKISVAIDGKLVEDLDQDSLRDLLFDSLVANDDNTNGLSRRLRRQGS